MITNCSRSLLLRYKSGAARALPTTRYYHHHGHTAAAAAAASRAPRLYRPRPVLPFAVAAFISGATVMAKCRHYLEVVPYTNRTHIVSLSPRHERELGESFFAEEKRKLEVVDARHPDSVRLRLVTDRIVHALHRGLGIDGDGRDAVMLRVTTNKLSRKAWRPQPQTSHLHGLHWEVILFRDKNPIAFCTPGGKIGVSTGMLHFYNTDAEIATVLTHEFGHIIARHPADITSVEWLLMPLRVLFSRRRELEADHIGILLLAAAGFDPHTALAHLEKPKIVYNLTLRDCLWSSHPSDKKRLQRLSQAKIMEEALELYREVNAMHIVADRYFR